MAVAIPGSAAGQGVDLERARVEGRAAAEATDVDPFGGLGVVVGLGAMHLFGQVARGHGSRAFLAGAPVGISVGFSVAVAHPGEPPADLMRAARAEGAGYADALRDAYRHRVRERRAREAFLGTLAGLALGLCLEITLTPYT